MEPDPCPVFFTHFITVNEELQRHNESKNSLGNIFVLEVSGYSHLDFFLSHKKEVYTDEERLYKCLPVKKKNRSFLHEKLDSIGVRYWYSRMLCVMKQRAATGTENCSCHAQNSSHDGKEKLKYSK